MHISEEKINRYIAIYLEEYGRQIDRAQALSQLTALICMLEAVDRHINKINNKNNYE